MPTCGEGSTLILYDLEDGREFDVERWQSGKVWYFSDGEKERVRRLGRLHTCQLCPPGFYNDDKDNILACTPAPVGYYVPYAGMREPLSCEPQWPKYSAVEGQKECNGIFINISYFGFQMLFVVYFVVLTYMISLAGTERFVAIYFFNIGPALDLISDIQYILSTPFYTPNLFYCCVIFVFSPNLLFVNLLLKKGASMWLFKFFPGYNEAVRDLQELANGVILITSLPKIFLLMLWIIISTVIYFPVFAIGAFCYQSKVIAIKTVWDSWVYAWTLSSNYRMEDYDIDTEMLNESLFSEFVFETMPQLTTQSINSYYTSEWTAIQYFSTVLSGFMTINGIYTFGYYSLYQGKKMGEIPTKSAILGFLTFELETNDQIEHRKELFTFYERILSRDRRIKKYEEEREVLKYELKLRNKLSLVLNNMEINYTYFHKTLNNPDSVKKKEELWDDLSKGYGRRDVMLGNGDRNEHKNYILEGDKNFAAYILKKVYMGFILTSLLSPSF